MIGKVELNEVITSFPDSASVKGKTAKQIDRNGIIGCEILRRFNVIFNYPEKYVVLKPYPTKIIEPFEHNMSGLEIYASGKTLREYYIESVIKNSPADLAGFKAGDQIISIDNVRMTDESLSGIYKNFQQAEGRFFELEVIRNGKSYKNSFRLKRAI